VRGRAVVQPGRREQVRPEGVLPDRRDRPRVRATPLPVPRRGEPVTVTRVVVSQRLEQRCRGMIHVPLLPGPADPAASVPYPAAGPVTPGLAAPVPAPARQSEDPGRDRHPALFPVPGCGQALRRLGHRGNRPGDRDVRCRRDTRVLAVPRHPAPGRAEPGMLTPWDEQRSALRALPGVGRRSMLRARTRCQHPVPAGRGGSTAGRAPVRSFRRNRRRAEPDQP
jgi:hypothetical protein